MQITIKSSAMQIYPETRKTLVERMAPLLQQLLTVSPARTTTVGARTHLAMACSARMQCNLPVHAAWG